MSKYVQGNLLNLFYHDGTSWKTLGYTQNNSLSLSNETTSISSKDHGLNPETEVTGSSWSLSGECYFTADNADVIIGMHEKKTPFSFAFGQVDQSDYAAGLKAVSGADGGAEAWTISKSPFIRYGNGLVTSATITANNGEVASLQIEVTGSGAMSAKAPTAPKSYTKTTEGTE